MKQTPDELERERIATEAFALECMNQRDTRGEVAHEPVPAPVRRWPERG